MKRSPILIAIGTMLLMTACSDDYFNKDVEGEYSDYIGYSVKVNGSDEFQSRSAVKSPTTSRLLSIEATEASIGGRQLFLHTEIIDSIPQAISRAKCDDSATASRGTVSTTSSVAKDGLSISAVVFDGDATDWPDKAEAQMYMHNDIVIAPWKTNRYWPRENGWIRFYAFSPIDALGNDGLGAISATEPSFSYTVADDITEQQDLLVGSEQYAGNKCETAQIDLGHALTAVKILIDGNVTGFKLTKLYISGLKNSGTYTYHYNSGTPSDGNNASQTHDAGAWTGLSYKGDGTSASYNVFSGTRELTGEGGKDVNGNANVAYSNNLNIDNYVDATPGNMVLLMMPQTLTTEAKITIEGYDEVVGTDVKLEATIGDGVKKWNKGEMVTYTLSFTSTKIEYHLEVTPEDAANDGEYYLSPYHGETDVKFHVRSYKVTTTPGGETEEAVDWEIDNTDMPFWIDQITANGSDAGTIQKNNAGVITNLNGTYSILPNLTSSTSHDRLKGQSIKGSEDAPWDLSANKVYDGKPINTANCYMVTAPGWYTLPLVYGNAIKYGDDNPESYLGDTDGTGETGGTTLFQNIGDAKNYSRVATLANGPQVQIPVYTLKKFFGANSSHITTPWIVSNNGRGGQFTPGEVGVQWQDEPCIITDVKLNDKGDYIIFRVREECINEGNAVITVRRSDENLAIMWSWHIWITDMNDNLTGDFKSPVAMTNRMVTGNYNADATTASNLGRTLENTFYLMHSNLGGCDADTKTYTKATKEVKFKIIENGVEVVQNPSEGVYVVSDVLKVGVNGAQITMPYNAPYYQFGRKDPMLPGWQIGAINDDDDNKEKVNKPFYKLNREKGSFGVGMNSEDGNFEIYGIEQYGGTQSTMIGHYMALINNPGAYFTGSVNDNIYSNLHYHLYTDENRHIYINKWNAKCNKLPIFTFYNRDAASLYSIFKEVIDLGVTKTVYDPCPPGYEIPRIDAFSGTTFNNLNINNWTTTDLVNVANTIPGQYGIYEAIGFYTSPMAKTGGVGTGEGNVFYIRALGHRNNQGNIAQYNNYGSAFTASPFCAQWNNQSNTLNQFFQFEAGRFCYTGSGWMRPFSSSAFDLAFPVIPARTGQNPLTTVIDGNASWSGDGNKDGGYNVEF